MPADPLHPDQLAGEQRFRADLPAYQDSLPIGELAELLGELPGSRQQPLQLGVLLVALNERLPDAFKLLPPAGHPGAGEWRRRSVREVVADGRAARTSRHPDAPASALAVWLAARQGRPSSARDGAGRVRWPSGGWPRRCVPGRRTPTRRPTARSTATRRPRRPTESASGRSRNATPSPRTSSAAVGGRHGRLRPAAMLDALELVVAQLALHRPGEGPQPPFRQQFGEDEAGACLNRHLYLPHIGIRPDRTARSRKARDMDTVLALA
jgi:hypothetical protein